MSTLLILVFYIVLELMIIAPGCIALGCGLSGILFLAILIHMKGKNKQLERMYSKQEA